ncbi:MAG: ferritin-like domain-containing protein [Candidatus Zixiibacteriota bacterium]
MKASELIEHLQVDLADELAAITQYMYHHVMVTGAQAPAITDLFRKVSIDEMKHAERLAERICELGGVPTVKPTEIKVGGDWMQMVREDLEGELRAIETYRKQIKMIGDDNPITRRLLEDLLIDENRHAEQWKTVLGK